jgi:Secretion system C-terminal sorting domain
MKNFKTFFKTQLTLAVVLFCASMGFAQLAVKVPIKCKVVLAGAGGTTGYGGIVGDGGIVCMPDPFDEVSPAGDFNIVNIPVTVPATTISSWTLKGDLSFTTATIAGAALQSAGAVLTTNIESYNKTLRVPSENGVLYPSSISKWGRSKGRVTIGYTSPPCNKSITFEVFKSYSNATVINLEPITWVPPIVGPDCVEPAKTYTFSVDQIASDNATDAIGFDSYYWSGFPAGFTNAYYSADKSSVTFTTPSTGLATFTLACAYGRCNPFDSDVTPASAATYVKKVVDLIPVAPALTLTNITGLSNASFTTCLNTGNPTLNFTVAVTTPLTGFSYTWSYGGGSWTSVISGAQQQIITLSNVDNNPGTLTLKIRKTSIPTGCESVFSYTINRNFTTAIAIAGPTIVPICLTAGSTNAFTLPSLAGVNALNNFTTWTVPLSPAVPTSWTVTNLNGPGSAVNIFVPANTPGGVYTIAAKSSLCPTGSINISVNVLPGTPTINTTSPICVDRGTTAIPSTPSGFSCTTVTGANGYSWDLTGAPGWSCSAGCNTTAPTFVPSGTSVGPVTITVKALGASGASCDGGNSLTYTVNYKPVTPNSITTSCWSLGVAGTTTITVANAPNPFFGTYTVTSAPAGLFNTYSVSATGVITLNTLATAVSGSYVLTITHVTTSCGSSLATALPAVTVAGNGATVTLTANVPGVGNCDQYTVSGAPSGSTYVWFVSGVQVANSATVNIFGNSLTLCGNGTAPTSVCVNATSGGCTTQACASSLGSHSAKQSNSVNTIFEGITISPNPNTGNFNIKVDNFIETAVAVLTDMTGKEIATYTLHKGENKIQNEGLSKGTYLVVLKIDGKQEARQIIIK